MIVFDLKCGKGHVFEAWFGSSADYDSQKKRRLLSCPLCGDEHVSKALMAPNVSPKSNQKGARVAAVSVEDHASEPSPEEAKQLLKDLADMQKKVEDSFDYVGEQFADEARRIHDGEAENRGIYGETTLEEAKALHDEGITILPLPFRHRRKRLNA